MLKIQQNYFYYAYGIDFLYCLCYNMNSFERNKKQKLKKHSIVHSTKHISKLKFDNFELSVRLFYGV